MLRKKNAWLLVFWLTIGLTWAIYLPGLHGGFLFDDMPNLSELGTRGGIENWESFKSFVFHGAAGPLGRPISLASFLLDDNFWPSVPAPFKQTNLLLHLLTGVLLCWATLNLLRLYGVREEQARWGAILNMGFWMLHPYMVSTTLYVVQRMAQLATLFVLAGLAGYLHGRLVMQRRRTAGYLWMTFSLGLGTVLASLSKENGILLPMLTLVIEWCRPRPAPADQATAVPPDWRWRMVFLWLPSLAVLWTLGKEINFSPNAWPTRPFNQIERLLTEPRIVWEYLQHLFIPRIEGLGLFQDGYEISTSLSSPLATLPSLFGLVMLLLAGLLLRRKLPYVALAILFFFASHLIESTVVGLELYFEHRNYAAAVFLFLPIVMGLLWLAEKKSVFIAATTLCAMLTLLALLTWQRATLWSNTEALQNYWAVTSPLSPRAQNHLAMQMFQSNQPEKGFQLLEQASDRLPQSSLLTMQWLLQKVVRQAATPQDFGSVKNKLPAQRFDAQALLGIRMIVDSLQEAGSRPEYRQHTLELLDVMRSLPRYTAVPLFNRLEPYLRGSLLLGQGQYAQATASFKQAIQQYQDIDAALPMVADMGNSNRPHEAFELLQAAKDIYAKQPDKTLKRSRESYEQEIERFNRLLILDMQSLNPGQK